MIPFTKEEMIAKKDLINDVLLAIIAFKDGAELRASGLPKALDKLEKSCE